MNTVSLRRQFDNTVYARRCACGAVWKIYQQPVHFTKCPALKGQQ